MEKGRCYWLDDCGYCIREYNEAQTKFLCTKRPSVCEDYIENFIGEPVYKRGDDVWYFDNEGFPTICHCSIAEVSIKKGAFPLYYVFEKSGRRIGWLPGHSLFESREALCEHYRKIFGGIDRKALLDGINALKKDAKERHEDDCYLHGLYDVMDMINEELG